LIWVYSCIKKGLLSNHETIKSHNTYNIVPWDFINSIKKKTHPRSNTGDETPKRNMPKYMYKLDSNPKLEFSVQQCNHGAIKIFTETEVGQMMIQIR